LQKEQAGREYIARDGKEIGFLMSGQGEVNMEKEGENNETN